MMREMASKRTAFFALECCTFLDLGGSWALLRIVSRHSVRRLLSAASSAMKINFQYLAAFPLLNINVITRIYKDTQNGTLPLKKKKKHVGRFLLNRNEIN